MQWHTTRTLSLDDALRQQFVNNSAWFDACQVGIQALEFVAEFVVVDSQLVKQRRVNVVDGDSVFDGVITEFIGRPVIKAGLEAPSCKPHGEAGQMMVAAFPWAIGVRPNSEPKTISVSFSMSRCLRSTIRAAIPWSTSFAVPAECSLTAP